MATQASGKGPDPSTPPTMRFVKHIDGEKQKWDKANPTVKRMMVKEWANKQLDEYKDPICFSSVGWQHESPITVSRR